MLVVVPSDHWPIVDALAAEGFDVVHVDAHIRSFLAELDPPISATPVMVNVGGSGRLSDKLAKRRQGLVRWRNQSGAWVDEVDEHRVTVNRHDGRGELQSVSHDVFDDVAERHPELRRMVGVLRTMLPRPEFAALEGDTAAVVGVDSEVQRLLLPAEGVRVIAIAGQLPPWAVEAGPDLVVIDAELSRDEQAAAAVEAVRQPVAA
jgi:hypothetical protein